MSGVFDNGIGGAVSFGSSGSTYNGKSEIYKSKDDIILRVKISDFLLQHSFINASIADGYLTIHRSLTQLGFETYKDMFQNNEEFTYI